MARRTRASRAERKPARAPITIGGLTVEAGQRGRVELPVGRLATGTWMTLPVAVLHGQHEGPTLWVSGTIHGDELNGIAIIRELLRRVECAHLHGTILAVPIVNVFGLVNGSRYLPDRRDLNRSFPGSKRGSLASQLAYLFMQEIVQHCQYGLDFHSGSGGRINLPQIRCDLDDPKTRELAATFGAPVMIHSKQRGGSLRGTAVEMGITTLLYEAGGAHAFHRPSIRRGVEGSLRVMQSLEMIRDVKVPPAETSLQSRKSSWARSRRGGMCQMSVNLGDHVKEDQELAVVFESLGTKDYAVRAPSDGVVIGQLDHALVNRGDAVAHVAEVESS